MDDFVNDQVKIASLPRWEQVDFERVSPRYRYVIVLNYLILCLIFSGVSLLIFSSSDVGFFGVMYVGMGALIVLGILCAFHLWAYSRWGYALRQQDVLYRSGIFTRRLEVMPYRHIQHVHVKEGLFSRLFALVSIEVFTAGSGKSIQILGVPRSDSARIQAFISSRISTVIVE